MLLIEKLPYIKYKNRSRIIVDLSTNKTYYYNKLSKEKISPILLAKEYVKEYLNYIVVEDRVKVKLKLQLKLISENTRISLVLPTGEIKEFKDKYELANRMPYKLGKKLYVYKISTYDKVDGPSSVAIFVRKEEE